MLYIWKQVIPTTVEEVVRDLKHEVGESGLLREVKDVGSDIMCTCPFHKGGRESKPSLGISKQEVKRGEKIYPQGTTHCFTCGYEAELPKFVADLLELGGAIEGYKHLVKRYTYGEDFRRGELELHMERDVAEEEMEIDLVLVTYYQEELKKSERARQYLEGRKLDFNVCLEFGLGYNPENDSIVIPIRDRSGVVRLVKERTIVGKSFLNSKGSNKAGVVYGLYEAIEEHRKRPNEPIWIVESETDALTIWSWGGIAVAIMGSHISDMQVAEMCKAPFRKVIAGEDNDDAGRKGIRILKDKLIPKGFRIFNVRWLVEKKDINELEQIEFKTKLELY